MVDPEAGPFLFDTSAETWLRRTQEPAIQKWMRQYLELHSINVSAITVVKRVRGYALAWQNATPERQPGIEQRRVEYLQLLGRVLALDEAMAIAGGEILALLPHPPTPPRTSHRLAESRVERLARWRFDCLIAATALVTRLPLIHNNPADFEAIRSAIEITPRRFPNLGPLELIRCTSVA